HLPIPAWLTLSAKTQRCSELRSFRRHIWLKSCHSIRCLKEWVMDANRPHNAIKDTASKNSRLIKRRDLLTSAGTLLAASSLALPALQPQTAAAQQSTGFSFAVYGDSRSMMYLPYKSEQREEAIKLMVDMFELVLPEKVAEEVVRRDVRLTYDPSTGELVQIVMPFDTKSEVTTLKLDKGWVTEASVEDVKLLPGVHKT